MKLIRISKYDNSQCNGQFVFFSPDFKEMPVKWFFPYEDDFDLKLFLKMYPELSETDVEIIALSQSDIILACDYSEIDAVLVANSELDFWVNDARFVKHIKEQLRR